MALRRAISKRLFCAANPDSPSPITTIGHPPTHPKAQPIVGAEAQLRRDYFTSRESGATVGFFRRSLQRRAVSNPFPSFLTLPVGEKLRENLESTNPGDSRFRLEGFIPPAEVEDGFRLDAADVKKVMRSVQMEHIKERLRNIPANTIPYDEYVQICGEVCADKERGSEFAKALDEGGNVIVVSGVVFLRPDQVTKSIEILISQSISMPNDPRRKELDNLENEKAFIDRKARSMVRGELYCGLGFMILQTLGFIGLTFWELSWDVMEPICFFVTSLHFALAYAFFLRTSKEPSFEGYFQRRFKVKQKQITKIRDFDMERYNQLRETFHPDYRNHKIDTKSLDHGRGVIFAPVHG